jgi:hypothetical protein
MIELLFVLATAVALVVLSRRISFRSPDLRTWLTLLAVGLIAAPGVIALVSLTAPLFPGDRFMSRGTVLQPVPAVRVSLERDPGRARAWLVRGFHVLDGDESRPVDYLEALVDTGGRHVFELARGGTLDLRMPVVSREEHHGAVEACPGTPVPDIRWSSGTVGPFGRAHRLDQIEAMYVPREARDPGLDGNGYDLWEVWLERVPYRRAALGSLLPDRGRMSRIHLFLTPLQDRSAVTAVPASAWWMKHGSFVVDRIRRGEETPQNIQRGSSSSTDFGKALSASGFLFLLAGSILLLMFSTHWVRTTCWLLLYSALYVSAVDRVVLRLHTAGLSMGETASRMAAAVETATTRLHPVSAARALLATALEDPDDAVRLTALRCLDRPGLRPALGQLPDAGDALERLIHAENPEVSSMARRLKRESRK